MVNRLTDQQLQEAITLFERPGQIALTHFEGRFVLLGRAYDAGAAAEINRIKSRSAGRPLVMCFPNLNLARRADLSSPLLSLLPYFQDRVTISIPAPPEISVAAHRGVGMIGVRWITADPLS
jgi:tRNA A37 threonylcarbamoyladenosine synthetase subunit TsaC/SUA5/YrdC